MVLKRGRWGQFLACTGYPECKTTRRLVHGTRKARQPDELLDEKCPECGSQLVKKHGRYGELDDLRKVAQVRRVRQDRTGAHRRAL